jgi:hypothetical protein
MHTLLHSRMATCRLCSRTIDVCCAALSTSNIVLFYCSLQFEMLRRHLIVICSLDSFLFHYYFVNIPSYSTSIVDIQTYHLSYCRVYKLQTIVSKNTLHVNVHYSITNCYNKLVQYN